MVFAPVPAGHAGEVTKTPPYRIPAQYYIEFATVGKDIEGKSVNGILSYRAWGGIDQRRLEWQHNGYVRASVRDKNVLYSIMRPGDKSKGYCTKSIATEDMQHDSIFPSGIWEKTGTERINGIVTDRYRVTNIKNQNKEIYGIYWIDRENQLPVRFIVTAGLVSLPYYFERKHLNLGPQRPEVFAAPRDLVRF